MYKLIHLLLPTKEIQGLHFNISISLQLETVWTGFLLYTIIDQQLIDQQLIDQQLGKVIDDRNNQSRLE